MRLSNVLRQQRGFYRDVFLKLLQQIEFAFNLRATYSPAILFVHFALTRMVH